MGVGSVLRATVVCLLHIFWDYHIFVTEAKAFSQPPSRKQELHLHFPGDFSRAYSETSNHVSLQDHELQLIRAAEQIGLDPSDFQANAFNLREQTRKSDLGENQTDPYSGTINRLERIVRHENEEEGWLTIVLDPNGSISESSGFDYNRVEDNPPTNILVESSKRKPLRGAFPSFLELQLTSEEEKEEEDEVDRQSQSSSEDESTSSSKEGNTAEHTHRTEVDQQAPTAISDSESTSSTENVRKSTTSSAPPAEGVHVAYSKPDTTAQEALKGNRESEPPVTKSDIQTDEDARRITPLQTSILGTDRGLPHGSSTSRFVVKEEVNALDSDSTVEIKYSFPVSTEESSAISFIVVALPPGYTAQQKQPLCTSSDVGMPQLTCTSRTAYIKNNPETLSTFITVHSAEPKRRIPLGSHSFNISVHTPKKAISVGNAHNWWFATFRFTGGHAITKHYENRKLITKQKCIWSEWRAETPCSSTCGDGYEIWTRSLFAGPSEEECGGAIMKRKCNLDACNLNCQLGEWETLADCTKSCGAKDGQAFRIRLRRVLLESQGWGQNCRTLYPWDASLGEGWSSKLQAVVSLSPCSENFKAPCPEELGCRVETLNSRTIPDTFPWGACPFPCGGFGSLTSITQVANGIPRWIGEKYFPESFQIPCKAATEPLITTRKCNIASCEDCSVYVESPGFGKATRAWVFFLPSAEADQLQVTVPRGMRVISPTNAKELVNLENESSIVAPLSNLLPSAHRPPLDYPQPNGPQYSADEKSGEESATESSRRSALLGTCKNMSTSFGEIAECSIGPSDHYKGHESATLSLRAVIDSPNVSEANGSSQRPHWFALPILLGSKEELVDAGHFYLWLTRAEYPKAPETFKCRLRTDLAIPRSCRFVYTPKNPSDCSQCQAEGSTQVKALRKFLPPLFGGPCDIPFPARGPQEVEVFVPCSTACRGLDHLEAAPQEKLEKATSDVLKPSTLRRLTRENLSKRLAEGTPDSVQRMHAAAGVSEAEKAFRLQTRSIDSLPLLVEEPQDQSEGNATAAAAMEGGFKESESQGKMPSPAAAKPEEKGERTTAVLGQRETRGSLGESGIAPSGIAEREADAGGSEGKAKEATATTGEAYSQAKSQESINAEAATESGKESSKKEETESREENANGEETSGEVGGASNAEASSASEGESSKKEGTVSQTEETTGASAVRGQGDGTSKAEASSESEEESSKQAENASREESKDGEEASREGGETSSVEASSSGEGETSEKKEGVSREESKDDEEASREGGESSSVEASSSGEGETSEKKEGVSREESKDGEEASREDGETSNEKASAADDAKTPKGAEQL